MIQCRITKDGFEAIVIVSGIERRWTEHKEIQKFVVLYV